MDDEKEKPSSVVAIWVGNRFVRLDPSRVWTVGDVERVEEWARSQPGYLSFEDYKKSIRSGVN